MSQYCANLNGGSREDLALRCGGLLTALGEERRGAEFIQFLKPPGNVRADRLQQHALRYAADANAVSLKAKLAGEADGLTAAVLKEFGDAGFGYGSSPA